MVKLFQNLFNNDMSVDLGTANTLIYIPDRGIVLNEPSVVAVRASAEETDKDRMLAVGKEAKTMIGRTSHKIEVIRPLKDGVVADFTAAEKMLQYFIRKATQQRLFSLGPRVLVCVPFGATPVERRAIKGAAETAGARKVLLYEEPLLAALGAGLNIKHAVGQFILDIGGGTSEVAVLSLSDIVLAESVRIGGDHFNASIIEYIRENFGLLIGEMTAESLKHEIGTAYHSEESEERPVWGRKLADGAPSEITVTSHNIHEALSTPLQAIVKRITAVLDKTNPDLTSDIMRNGIVVTGGGALLQGIDKFLQHEIRISVRTAESPLSCVARGGGIVLQSSVI